MPTKKVVSTKTKTPKTDQASRKTTPTPSIAAMVRPSDDEIRLRAYQLFLQRDGHAGDPLADWLRAESELTSAVSVVTAAKPRAATRKASGRAAS